MINSHFSLVILFPTIINICNNSTRQFHAIYCIVSCLFARHGRNHTVMPSDINYRANIHALKEEGCTHLLVTTACGSLQQQYKPGDIVFPDQFIDRTTKRASTFYDGKPGSPVGVCHIPMHQPYCPMTRQVSMRTP